ncbi:MAG: hypothetical protein IJP34_05200 [Clostridia bacterium]|nr:hypothetical protein [Clostridia bacterium]
MDTFFEQIVKIKKSPAKLFLVIAIWALTILLTPVIAYFSFIYLKALMAFVIFGLYWGVIKLVSLFNIEYEYIVTNGCFDVDKIINKSSRKRILSFDLGFAQRIEKYNPNLLQNVDKKTVTFACNQDDDNAYLLVAQPEGKSACYLVFSPDERMQGAIKKFVPKYIANSAFKD